MAKQRPEFLRLVFQEALDYFKEKAVFPTDTASAKRLKDEIHDHAFIVTGLVRADLLEDIKGLIEQDLKEGGDLETFQKRFNRLVGRKGWNPGGARQRIIYETNIRRSHSAGRWRQTQAIAATRSILVWRHRTPPPELGGKPRPEHKKLHNKGFPAKHRFWKVAFPSCAHGCRCGAYAVTPEQAKRLGVKLGDRPPDPNTIAEKGFRHAPGSSPDSEKQAILKDGLKRLSPRIRGQAESYLKKGGHI